MTTLQKLLRRVESLEFEIEAVEDESKNLAERIAAQEKGATPKDRGKFKPAAPETRTKP